MSIKNIIFDWDGTLGMSLHLWLEAYRNALSNQGHAHSDTFITRELFYEHDASRIKHRHIDFPLLVTDAQIYLNEHLPELVLYDQAIKTLEGLVRKEINLTLVTSSPRASLELGMKAHGLKPFFSSIISGDQGFGHKPDPAPFIETMKRAGAGPDETLIIGDARTDIIAGKGAGTKTCLFKPPENRLFHDFDTLDLLGADFTIGRLDALLEIL